MRRESHGAESGVGDRGHWSLALGMALRDFSPAIHLVSNVACPSGVRPMIFLCKRLMRVLRCTAWVSAVVNSSRSFGRFCERSNLEHGLPERVQALLARSFLKFRRDMFRPVWIWFLTIFGICMNALFHAPSRVFLYGCRISADFSSRPWVDHSRKTWPKVITRPIGWSFSISPSQVSSFFDGVRDSGCLNISRRASVGHNHVRGLMRSTLRFS